MTTNPSSAPPPVALIVDGDNVPPRHADWLVQQASRRGRVDMRRAYVDKAHLAAWSDVPDWSIRSAGIGKNASDFNLALDCAELLLLKRYAEFVIVSSDSDFAQVARWLKSRGAHVVGIGEGKSPEAWRRGCSTFMLLPGTMPNGARPSLAHTTPNSASASASPGGSGVSPSGMARSSGAASAAR